MMSLWNTIAYTYLILTTNYHHISGPWKSTAYDVAYDKNTNILCAKLVNNDGNHNKNCIDLAKYKNDVELENVDGSFFVVGSLPQGNWYETSTNIIVKDNGDVCANLLERSSCRKYYQDCYGGLKIHSNKCGKNEYECKIFNGQNECIKYNDVINKNNYYINENGYFKKLNKNEYITHLYYK